MNRRAFLHMPGPLPVAPIDPEGPDLAASGLTFRPFTPAPPRELPGLAPLKVQAGLEPYPEPLDRRRAAHLLRRTGFGTRPADVSAITGLSATEVVDFLVDAALDLDLPPEPAWKDEALPRPPDRGAPEAEQQEYRQRRDEYLEHNATWFREHRTEWLAWMFYAGLREKMALFWSNHFVTEAESYANLAVYAYRYLRRLRTHALGNFKAFVREIGLDGAMLIYLNGNTNEVSAPNENYARELLELFTMSPADLSGSPNYSQDDIEELARALTGWVVDPYVLEEYFIPRRHDPGPKTLFGQSFPGGTTENEYARLIDLLFAVRARPIAEFISEKLYREFVYAAPDPTIVAELADVMLTNDFEIAPVVRTLLKSAHFFDTEVGGAQIKSPVVATVGLLRELYTDEVPEPLLVFTDRVLFLIGQRLFEPPNVAGWPGHHSWLDTTTLPFRWLVSDAIVFGERGDRVVDLMPLAGQLVDPYAPLAVFDLPVALASHLLPVPVEEINLDAPADGFAGDLVNNPLPPEIVEAPPYVRDLAVIFLAGVPWYEWTFDQSGGLLLLYTRYLTQLPEFQLT